MLVTLLPKISSNFSSLVEIIWEGIAVFILFSFVISHIVSISGCHWYALNYNNKFFFDFWNIKICLVFILIKKFSKPSYNSYQLRKLDIFIYFSNTIYSTNLLQIANILPKNHKYHYFISQNNIFMLANFVSY